jgi:selenocysteine lyase/cysteine desulfurase
MMNAWNQRVRRDGIVLKEISIPVRASDAEIVSRYKAAMTPRTKAMEIMHISFLTGQIFPVAEVVALGRTQGIPVLIDGAHAYGHFPFTRDSLGADYYGTSLHKWLHAPIGTGFLYVRRDKIEKLWPLMAANADQTANIRKYEEIGTHPAANHNAIAIALAFQRSIGIDRKVARLRYLTQRWAKPLQSVSDRVKIHTPIESTRAAAIALVEVEGIDVGKLRGWLWGNHRIITTVIQHADFRGLRVTPSIYTNVDEVDRFAELVTRAIRTGIA